MPFSVSAVEIIDELDRQWSPTVEIEFDINGRRHALACHLDTGSLDSVVVTDFAFATQVLGLRFNAGPRAPREIRVLANGAVEQFVVARATANWFVPRVVQVLAPDPTAGSLASAGATTPRVLLGIPLLLGTQLSIDFLATPGAVRIVAPPAGYVAPVL